MIGNDINLKGTPGFKGERGYSAFEIAKQHGWTGTEEDWLAQLGTSSHFEECSDIYTATDGQTVFTLPDCYTSNSFVDVYVNGSRKNSDEYSVDFTNKTITLTSGTATGDKIEVITLTMSTNNLPIVQSSSSATTQNVLSAKTIVDDLYKNYIVDEITVNKYHHESSNTDYYIAHIPHTDKAGNIIKIKRGFAKDATGSSLKANETVRSFANRHKATLCINASAFNPTTLSPIGLIIHDGEIINNSGGTTVNNAVLGIKEDNTLIPYAYDVQSSVVMAAGCKETIVAFNHLLINGVRQSINIPSDYRYQWNILAQNTTTKDFYLFVCDGKNNNGMTIPEALDVIESLGCDYAYRLDQGGSTSLIYKGEMINVKTDSDGYKEREVGDFLYFSKDMNTQDEEEISYIYKRIGDIKEKLRNLELDLYNKNEINGRTLFINEKDNQGASVVAKKDGASRCSVVLDHPSYPLSFTIFDYINNRTSFRVEPDGYMTTSIGKYGFFPKYIPASTNINELSTTTIVYCQPDVKDSPYIDKPAFIINLAIGTGTSNICQIAIPMSSALEGSLTVKIRNKTSVNGIWTWSDWYPLALGGN